MALDSGQLEHLLRSPSETLNVELKSWIDPGQPEGAAKIVKGCVALRNRNGGFLVIGVDDKSLAPQPCPTGRDPAADFHVDRLQDLVSRHASEAFAIEVVLVPSPVGLHPVIGVPAGVRTPVAVKKSLAGAKGDLLRVGEVPFRTLNANGRASTAAARPDDWRDIVEICFDNREADVARFLRRHLSAVTPNLIQALVGANAEVGKAAPSAQALDFLDSGRARFEEAAAKVDVRARAAWGGWEVALVLDPPLENGVADRAFLDRVYAANPSYSGWPIWVDLRGMRDFSPVVVASGWEALAAFDSWYDVLDFYRFEPTGRFYSRRPHFDDGMADSRKATPGLIFDPVPAIADVGEALAVGLAIAHALGVDSDGQLGFAFRWSGLANRRLTTLSPVELGAVLVGQHTCRDASVQEALTVPAGTSPLAVAPYTRAATRQLLAAFNGFSVGEQAVERIVTARLERRTA